MVPWKKKNLPQKAEFARAEAGLKTEKCEHVN